MDPPHYRYESLDRPGEIRVLKISSTQTRIEIYILHVPVSSYSFWALSYVWGRPEQANKAVVIDKDGESIGWIPLTKNLGNAVCDLRDAESLKSKFLWIDQICINQQDEKEKNEQVAMMSQIYTQARQVITYLGCAGIEEEEERGIRLLRRIRSHIPNDVWQQIHNAGSLEQVRDRILNESIQLKQLQLNLDFAVEESYEEDGILRRCIEQGWDWLVRVAYGEWTQRLWIVQEQLLNKDITTLRGPRLIDWDSIITIPTLFAIGHLPQQYRDIVRRDLDGKTVPLDEVERTTYGIWWDRHARSESGTGYSWSSLCHNLQWYQPLMCGDAPDRIYAILAISHDSAALGLKPDYSPRNTVDTLSKQFSTRVLENGVNLELLSFSLSWRRPNSALPSWCLELDRTADDNTPAIVPVGVYTPHPISHRNHLARFLMNDSILAVKGRVLDCISARNLSIASICDATSDLSRINFLSSLMHTVPDKLSTQDIVPILRTITARAPWSPSSAGQVSADNAMAFHFWAYLRHSLRLLGEHTGTLPTTAKELFDRCDHVLTDVKALTPYNAYPDSQITDEIGGEEYKALERVLEYSLEEGRRFGRTSTGRFFNAIGTVQDGDSIVALQGSDHLFLIRQVITAYRLIGDVFVDGLMHGEAYENQDPDTVDYDIELE